MKVWIYNNHKNISLNCLQRQHRAIPEPFITLNCLNKTNDEKFVFNMTCLDNGQWLLPPSLCISNKIDTPEIDFD